MAFCPKCGDEAVDVFCEACLREREPLLLDAKRIVLSKCATCDRINIRSRWVDLDEFPQLVKDAVSFHKQAIIHDVEFPTPVLQEKPREFELPLTLYGTVSDKVEPYQEEYEVHVDVNYDQCDRCNLAVSNYFEGTLQLRNPRSEVVEWIEKRIQSFSEPYVTSAKDVRGGIDFQFTDQQFMHAFAHELHKQFGGVIKMQSRLHTYNSQTSKKVFRLTALIRLPKFWRGDVIESGKHLACITRMGSTLGIFELRRRKKSSMACPSDDEIILHEVEQAVLSSVKPKPMILDPETYQEVALAHPLEAEPGQEVPVVQDERGKWYVARQLDEEKEHQ